MQKYGLKVTSPYDKSPEQVITGSGDIVLTQAGSYRIKCIGDTYVHHNVVNGIMHLVCESQKDDIEIQIKSSGMLSGSEVADVYHRIVANNKNIKSKIDAKGVVSEDSKIIYRSSLDARDGTSGEGSQSGKFLILSNTSEVDAEPSLDIASDAFPTTHSVAIGGVDKEKLFYIKLKGLNNKDAEDEIVAGFLNS